MTPPNKFGGYTLFGKNSIFNMETHYEIYPTPADVAAEFAAFFKKWSSGKKPFTVALSGGSTPKILFQHLAENYRDAIDWRHVHFFWGDERCVPPDDEDSNFKMTDETLFQHIGIPKENIHRIRGEAEPAAETERYAAEIQQFVKTENGWPRFDLVILGIGGDGHTASIFPDRMELLTSDKICAVATHPESGQQRISLTGRVIGNARKVAFLVTGAGKKSVVEEIRERTGDWETYPASHVRAAEDLYWFLDEKAAGR
jgi:6-phosphogluconolactonase